MRSLIIALSIAVLPFTALAGDKVKVTNLEKVNTEADEDNPFLFPDGSALLFDSNRNGSYELFASKRTTSVKEPWSAAKPYLSSKEADYRSPFLRNGVLFFAQNKVPDEKLKDLKNYDIVQKLGMQAPLPLVGISEQEDELHPWISASGKEFFFSRKLKTGWTQFVALGPTPGPIGKAKEAGVPAGFCHATLTSNGLTMYLQGPIEREKERLGLFRSKRAKIGGDWSAPEPLDAINSPNAKRGDMSPSLSSDGTRLYFASDRPGGKGGLDIWMVLTKELK